MKNLNITALITARGSNSLERKHLRLVSGKPLIEYPFMIAQKCHSFTNFYVSSDDVEILKIGKQYGFTPIKRPVELSTSTALHTDAIKHALKTMEQDSVRPDILVVILGNTVYLKSDWIEDSIKIIKTNSYLSSVVPVYLDQDHHPYRAKTLDKNGLLNPYFPKMKNISTNRQDLPINYFLCHNFWTLNVKKSILQTRKGQPPWTFLGRKIYPLILDNHLDVHSEEDIVLCEHWLAKNK